ncbi:hypothetical protein QTH89_15660 [Variovorax sp. J22G21]|uniref:hypothetical protein n=1 Tax=Variovorax fucosicus TaxID=3053517 RepID=UPI0025749EC1|nr:MULTISPECIES: hypothetical protein [unclassified Variovorax]MDM0037864.1 hypothetical protein [Variovorax sp. J22R193]MDM0062640.1 hypothetical protein [Variovorax sp. J22G21]
MRTSLLYWASGLALAAMLSACGGGGDSSVVDLSTVKVSATTFRQSEAAAIAEADVVLEKAAGPARVPLYRFFNTNTGTHFYTRNTIERDQVIANYRQFQFEGVGYYAYDGEQAGLQPVYRFFNTRTGSHFYTISQAERDQVRATLAQTYSYEGVAWYASTSAAAGTAPIYRFFNTATGTHFYTVSASERAEVIAHHPNYSNEGIGYYAWPGADGNGQPTIPLSPTFTTVNLTLTGTTPAAIQSQSYESMGVPTDTFWTFSAQGDFGVLAGKPLFVYIDDPDGLYSVQNALPFYNNGQGGLFVQMKPNAKEPGTYRGNFKIYACLDFNCSVRLGNVPLSMPYDVVVKRNVRFDANGSKTINVGVPFGAATQQVALKLNPAEGTAMGAWYLTTGAAPPNLAAVLTDDGDGKGSLRLSIPGGTPAGNYNLDYFFWSKGSAAWVPSTQLTVKLEVAQSTEPYVLAPATATLTSLLAHEVYYQYGGFSATAARGTLALAAPGAEEILYTPEQQTAIPVNKRTRFIEASRRDYQPNPSTTLFQLGHTACVRTFEYTSAGLPINNCLPAGNYAFRIKLLYTLDGSTMPVDYLGTFVVAP